MHRADVSEILFLGYCAFLNSVTERKQFVIIGWLLLLAIVVISIVPSGGAPAAVRSRHLFPIPSAMPAYGGPHAGVATSLALAILGFPQTTSIHFYPADSLLAFECARLC